MYVLFLVLNRTEYLDNILTEFVNINIKGATILDSQGMASALISHCHDDIPVIGSLRNFIDNCRPYNKTIFTVLEDDEMVEKAVEAINKVVEDLSKPGIGFMFTVPVGRVYGIPKKE